MSEGNTREGPPCSRVLGLLLRMWLSNRLGFHLWGGPRTGLNGHIGLMTDFSPNLENPDFMDCPPKILRSA